MIRAHEYPTIGTWYVEIETNQRFEVVAKDEETNAIEIQYFSGEIEELDADTWFAMRLASIASPKDWSGPFEIDKEEFSELSDEAIHPLNWSDPFSSFEDEK